MKPVIGITVDCVRDPEEQRTKGLLTLNWNYAQAAADAGGVPIIIPPQADMSLLANMIDGWLIPGGADIDAARFGEENHPEVGLQDPARYDAESRLFEAVAPEMPVLGICYGCQFLNVVRGGSLEQHLPDRVGHTEHTGGTLQTYPLLESKLKDIVDAKQVVGKSYHHQAVKRLGQGLVITSWHEDNTVEAIEATDRPWMIGVQWHPERTADDDATQRIFIAFVAEAAKFAERRARQTTGVA
jgi:putative glutamine amidotransferase